MDHAVIHSAMPNWFVSQERQLKYVLNSGSSNAFKCQKLGQGIFLLYNILQCILELTVLCHILLGLVLAGII